MNGSSFVFFNFKLLIFVMIFISRCHALSPLVVDEIYKHLENEYSKFCYKTFFGKTNNNVKWLNNALVRNLPQNICLKKIDYKNQLPAYEKAVLVSMVKNEEDIVFENLCWHYFMGFRKFIIIDNGSSDRTNQLIDKFEELTASSTSVVKIQDPEVAFKQTSRTNAGIRLAEILFPDVTWIFPNDADEFILFESSIEDALSSVSSEVNCIYSPRITYVPTEDYFTYSDKAPFYESIQVAHKRNSRMFLDMSEYNGKTFLRAHKNLLVVQGNHFLADVNGINPQYISGLECGMHIREYPLRSPQQTINKFINVARAFKLLECIYKNLCPRDVMHQRYKRYLEIGDAYGMEEFRDFMKVGGYSFNERMPLELALKAVDPLFCEFKRNNLQEKINSKRNKARNK